MARLECFFYTLYPLTYNIKQRRAHLNRHILIHLLL